MVRMERRDSVKIISQLSSVGIYKVQLQVSTDWFQEVRSADLQKAHFRTHIATPSDHQPVPSASEQPISTNTSSILKSFCNGISCLQVF